MKNKIRQNNSGFTLVELVITIAVLAVISIPLLKYFSDSMRHNVRMKEEQNAVVAAQNVLEDLKVSDISLDNIANLTSPAALTSVSWQKLSEPTSDPDGNETYSVKGNYSLNKSSYTVTAKVTLRDSVTNDSGSTQTYQKVEVPSMDSSNDAISTETGQYLANAKFHFYGLYEKYCDDHNVSTKDPSITTSYIGQCLQRKITVSVTPNVDSAGAKTGKLDILTTYTYQWRSDVSLINGVSSASSYSENVEQTTIPGKGTHNLFLFYTPVHYKINEADDTEVPSVIPDEVEIKGDITSLSPVAGVAEDDLNLKLYLVADASVPRTKCATGSAYTLKLKASDNINNYVSDVFTNLSNTEFTTGGFAIDTSTFPSSAGYGFHPGALMKQSAVNRVADIEVSVFKGDSTSESNRFTTVNGTKVQK